MTLSVPTEQWESLVTHVQPCTVAEGDIKTVSVIPKNGQVKAETLEPRPSVTLEEDLDEQESNDSTLIDGDTGRWFYREVYTAFLDAIQETPPTASTDITRCLVSEDGIQIACRVEFAVPASDVELYEPLAEYFREQGRIDDDEEFAFGELDKCWESNFDDWDGWETDGTMYKRTPRPYDYWSAGEDSDKVEPVDEESWAEFASDSDAEAELIRDKEKHLIHFHPSNYGVDEDHFLVQWFKQAEEHFKNSVETSGECSLNSVAVNPDYTYLTGTITL